ncbi:MAG TPA: DUF4142 domain-containing protein [Anaeromyxobacter sp.]|nr:DUF4142 domain-containing protein [Anaeromyxobacter sp.]
MRNWKQMWLVGAAAAVAWASPAWAAQSSAKLSRSLADGLAQLHGADQGEIQSGQLAAQNASSSDVKAFGQRMVDEHGQNDQQLRQLAQTLGVSLEGKAFAKEQKSAQKTMKSLQGKTGSAFDRAYVSAMVKDHEKDAKDVKKLADQARKDGQTELASFLDQTGQTIESHLSAAKELQSSERSAARSAATTTGTGSMGAGTSGASGTMGGSPK